MPDAAETEVVVRFAAHMPRDRIAAIASGIAAYGNVYPARDGMSLVVKVFRASKLPRLQKQLQAWEKYGFLQSEQHG